MSRAMKDSSGVAKTDPITTSFANVETAVSWSKALLEGFGFTVIAPAPKWMKLCDFRKALGVPASTLTKALRDPCCPRFISNEGPSGRINKLVPTPELQSFLLERFSGIERRGLRRRRALQDRSL